MATLPGIYCCGGKTSKQQTGFIRGSKSLSHINGGIELKTCPGKCNWAKKFKQNVRLNPTTCRFTEI